MRRLLLALIVVAITALPAHAKWRGETCRYGDLDGSKRFSVGEVRKTIACAAHKWAVPGGVGMALCIAERESSFFDHADNPYSSASGVFQMLDSTWSSWRLGSLYDWAHRWRLSPSVWNGRANVMIGVQAMHRYGLSPWGGDC